MFKISKIIILAAITVFAHSSWSAKGHEAIYPGGVKPSIPYTPGIKLANGMLFISGQIAYQNGALPAYAHDGKNDMEDQSKIVMENLKRVLDTAGYTFDDAVYATVYMSDIKNYTIFNKVYATYWGKGKTPPARVAVEVGALPGGKPGAPILVEVSIIASK
ncbi:RidA family protein [Agarilytica rhodophyticola]|uniref:RidA family protein n=1 Tax=Agarilytica rhodophyticola TaxID=1737490 RepID=UPI000B345D22|nr:RidA family protein [Agarilytica rhodophyticola]